jgi:hypothetical protein
MYWTDHPPPHFHAYSGEHDAQIAIATGEVMDGELPRRALRLVKEWTELHRSELMDNWEKARRTVAGMVQADFLAPTSRTDDVNAPLRPSGRSNGIWQGRRRDLPELPGNLPMRA